MTVPLRRVLVALGLSSLAFAFVGNMALDPFDPDPAKSAARYALVVPQALGLTILFGVALRNALSLSGNVRAGVLLLAFGVAGWAWGNWAWTYYNASGVDVPYPSLADLGYLGLSACAIAGLAVLFHANRRRLQGVDIAIAAAFPLTVGILFYTFLIAPRWESGAPALTQITNLSYPTGDAVYVGLAGLTLFFCKRSAITPSLRRFAVGLLLMAVTDVVFIVGVDRGFYFTGSWIDQMYILATAAYAWAVCAFAAPPVPARPAPAPTPATTPAE